MIEKHEHTHKSCYDGLNLMQERKYRLYFVDLFNKVDLLSEIRVGFDKDKGIGNSKDGKEEQHVLPQWSWEKHVIRLAE